MNPAHDSIAADSFYEAWLADFTDAEQAEIAQAFGVELDEVAALDGPVADWFWDAYWTAGDGSTPTIDDVRREFPPPVVATPAPAQFDFNSYVSNLFGFGSKGRAA